MEERIAKALGPIGKKSVTMLDVVLAGLYTGVFALSLHMAGYDLDTVAAVTIVHVALLAAGWRNPPINLEGYSCILYRTGFLPLYASLFALAAWLYTAQIDPLHIAAFAAALLATYAIFKTVSARLAEAVLAASIASGILVYLLTNDPSTLVAAFAAPQLALAAARPRTLCDDRPLFYAAGIYASIAFLALWLLSTQP
ncbi:hypothetical protein Pyrfu_1536 [Pyrolobus fumarii 1A]|uniref:Uncharacterized protein n=1 Tax=Pyrolobus fumarii (strain DSM 11204 / 1A) TaxID=694429 RepID=G0EHP0_PYRF1|nr:hypothetical protein [Pyrolobus fumarii]AEM39393.1 hypothetical protein Pyrfu_1536 [Pyrolobus fumarii 1A]